MDLTTLGPFSRTPLDLKFYRLAGRSGKVKVRGADLRNSRNQKSRDQKNLMSDHLLYVMWRGWMSGRSSPDLKSAVCRKTCGKYRVTPVSSSEFHTEVSP